VPIRAEDSPQEVKTAESRVKTPKKSLKNLSATEKRPRLKSLERGPQNPVSHPGDREKP
jgi:hypothetical protein